MKHIVLIIWVLLGFQVESILFYGNGSNYFGAVNVSDGGLFQIEQRNIGVENPIVGVEIQENRAAVLLLDDSKSDIAIEDGKSEAGVQLGQNLGEFFDVEYKTWVKYPGHLAGPFTGGFGEQSCHSCHFDYDLNMPDGVLELNGLPEVVELGKRYELEVLISRPDLGAAGFQLTSRFENGSQAGNFILNDEIIFTPNTSGDSVNNQNAASPKPIDVTGATPGGTVSGNNKYSGKNNGVMQYVQHAVKNIDPENGQKIWKFSWTAPDQIHANAGKSDSEANGSKSQRIIFNIAGNAANGDESAFEDWILVKEFRIDIENE